MTAVRRILAGLAATGLTGLCALLPAGAASAHGTATSPVSRTAACTPGSAQSVSAACRAASEANGRPFGNFDNLRVPGVAGRDKQYIPDGNLCSGDLPEFSGLDLARDDWPATAVKAGQKLDIRYAGTIPHRGEFRVYLTRQGYDPERPLGWADLTAEPLFTAADPPLRDGAYRMSGKIPADRSGRHLLYIVWENTSTPDTYYSCSDLDVAAVAGAGATVKSTAKPKPAVSRSPDPGVVATPPEQGEATSDLGAPAAEESWISRTSEDVIPPGRQIASAALIVAAGISAGVAITRIRRNRRYQGFGRPPGNG